MDRAKLGELVCALPTHLFAEGERGWTVRTAGSNVTPRAAGMKRVQIQHATEVM